MKTPLASSNVPIAPSHNTGDLLSRDRKSVVITWILRIQDDCGFCLCGRAIGPRPVVRVGWALGRAGSWSGKRLCYNPGFCTQIFVHHALGSSTFEESRACSGGCPP